jgi:hypothetical protein
MTLIKSRPLLPRAQNSLHFVKQGFSLAVSRPKGLPYKNDIFRCKQYYAPLNNCQRFDESEHRIYFNNGVNIHFFSIYFHQILNIEKYLQKKRTGEPHHSI